jgi:hypothetical protein
VNRGNFQNSQKVQNIEYEKDFCLHILSPEEGGTGMLFEYISKIKSFGYKKQKLESKIGVTNKSYLWVADWGSRGIALLFL